MSGVAIKDLLGRWLSELPGAKARLRLLFLQEVVQGLSSRFSAHSLLSGFATATAEEEASLKKIME